jgi:hypothetical protein
MIKDYVATVISVLNKLHMKYVFTGGFALSYYGFPRGSSDFDVIVEKNYDKLLKFSKILREKDFSVLSSDIEHAFSSDKDNHFAVFYKRTMFPYFDFKVASGEEDERAIRDFVIVDFRGVKCRIVGVENLIVKKLEWGDDKDVENVLYRYKRTDYKKLFKLAKEKGVDVKLQDMIHKIKRENE